MNRTCMAILVDWLHSQDRKPLVIRGARQVGKTWLVRYFAQMQNRRLIEVNFEKNPEMSSLFSSNDPHQILLNLSATFGEPVDPEKCILFLDEIQAAPLLLAKLRWFYEDIHQLPIISAGSLLEFVLEQHTFSMPVGRISYMHLEPLSFEEFLLANEKEGLLNYLVRYQWEQEIPIVIHEQLMTCMREYMIVGGMPAAVSSWIKKKSLKEVNQIHHDLIATYRDDFAKYKGRISMERLDEVLMAVPKHLGEKFIYTKVNSTAQTVAIKQSLALLCKARICNMVMGSSANGVPLSAEIQDKYFKVIFIDVGLASAALGLTLDLLYRAEEINLINKGGIAEQIAGQLLRTILPPYIEPRLYYWHREAKGSEAEIDYAIQHGNSIIPVEIKAGSTGSLKSLHFFMGQKGFSTAVRINSNLPSITEINVKNNQGKLIQYMLLSLPFYLLGQLHRLVDEFQTGTPK